MSEGTIKTIVVDKGFGFITPDDDGADVFFHYSALIDLAFNEQLRERRVRFQSITTERGPKAVRVEPAH